MAMATKGMIGADIGRLRGLASEFSSAADRIDAEIRAVSTSVRNTPWQGATADRFRQSWSSVHSARLRGLANQLRDAARILRANADDQERVSNAGAAGGPRYGGLALRIASGLVPAGGLGLTFDWNSFVTDLGQLGSKLNHINSIDDYAVLLKAFSRMNELPLLQVRGLPVLDLLLEGAQAMYWITNEGIADARSWEPIGNAGLLLASMGIAVAMFGAAAAAPAAAAAGLGGAIGRGIDEGIGNLTGKKLTDRWADAALGTDDFQRRIDTTEIHKGMSAQEIQRRADEVNRLAEEARKKTEKTKTPWGCLELMFSI